MRQVEARSAQHLRYSSGVAILFSLASSLWLIFVVGQSSSATRHAATKIMPIVQSAELLETHVLEARIGFIYYAALRRPGSLGEGWAAYRQAQQNAKDLERALERETAAAVLAPHLDTLHQALALYDVRLRSVLQLVDSGVTAGDEYNSRISEWAAAGSQLVKTGHDVEEAGAALLKSEQLKMNFLTRFSLVVVLANGLLWLALAAAYGWTEYQVRFAQQRASEPAVSRRPTNGLGGLLAALLGRVRNVAVDPLRVRTLGGCCTIFLAIFIVLGTGVFALRSIGALTSEQHWAMHSGQVLTDSGALRTAVYAAESEARSYNLSGRESLLPAEHAYMETARETCEKLRGETQDNAEQQQRIESLHTALEARFRSMVAANEARRDGGLDAATKLIRTATFIAVRNGLESRIQDFEFAERQLLVERVLSSDREATISKSLIWFAGLPATLGLALLGVLTIQALREAVRYRDRMEHLAHHDALTGLPNRQLLKFTADQLLAYAERSRAQAAVLWIDLDRFKQVNDQHGHEAGDSYLVAVSQRMSSVLRRSDTLLRVGGDEFICLLGAVRSEEDAELVASKLLASLAEPIRVGQVSLHASLSIGIAMYPQDGRDWESLSRMADAALYQAKNEGRGRFWKSSDVQAAKMDPAIRNEQELRILCETGHRISNQAQRRDLSSPYLVNAQSTLS